MVFTSEVQDELWEVWARGESSRLIARKLRSTPHAVRAVSARHGGVRPPARAHGKQQLNAAEGEEIERINTRPRRVLDWNNSHELFWSHVRARYVP